jgi:ribokinase
MKILNFGSLNIDHVYSVEHFVRPGETISSGSYKQYCGGKGLNQSIALARAGAEVYHAGRVGSDGSILLDTLEEAGVDTRFVIRDNIVSGHAIIQVNADGDNCIILYGGANQNIASEDIGKVLGHFSEGDYVLLQNEINNIHLIMDKAKKRGLKIVFNPAPMNSAVLDYPLELVDIFIVNEVEGCDLTGKTEPEEIINAMLQSYPQASVVLTLGAKGAIYADNQSRYAVPADTSIKVVDTTAAGDTYIGYFLSSMAKGISIENAMKLCSKACGICVSRSGASNSIPLAEEV